MQDLGAAIVSRIIVTPNTSFTSFAIGPNPPTTNVGPWLKNCLTWFVFDDTTASYVPIEKGGFNSYQVFNSSGTFTVPSDVHKIMVEAWGAGGGGGNSSGGISGGGGGGGGYGRAIYVVTPAQLFPIVVGSGGANGNPGVTGGNTTFSTMAANGGVGGAQYAGGAPGLALGGAGGTVTGADISTSGQCGYPGYNSVDGSSVAGGLGGSSPSGGGGGMPHTAAVNINGATPGGGGSGGSHTGIANAGMSSTGGIGANGRVIVWY